MNKKHNVRDEEMVIVVDKKDKRLGFAGKAEAHEGLGMLHRAISVWVADKKGQILVTKRSKYKKLWPLYWTNTVCSHPRINESYVRAGERRLMEELGFTTKLRHLYKFVYEAEYKDRGWEKELAGVLAGKYDGRLKLSKKEVADYRWVGWKELLRWSGEKKEKFTPWFFLERDRLENDVDFKRLVQI